MNWYDLFLFAHSSMHLFAGVNNVQDNHSRVTHSHFDVSHNSQCQCNAPSSDCVVPCIVKSGRDYDNGMRSLDLVLLLALAHLYSMWFIYIICHMDHKILHFSVYRGRGWYFSAPDTHVLMLIVMSMTVSCMGSRTATGIFPALRLVHSLLKYFFSCDIEFNFTLPNIQIW